MSHTNTTTNYGLPQFLSSDKPAWMSDINVAFADIDSQMKTNADAASAAQTTANDSVLNGAPGYSNLSTYAVGDVVNYLGRVYKCDIAVTTPEAFDNAKWSYYRLSDASAQIDVIDGEIGNTDISSIGDGTLTGAVSSLNDKITSNTRVSEINISAYDIDNPYIAPYDGYVQLRCVGAGTAGQVEIDDQNGNYLAQMMISTDAGNGIQSTFVKKGMRIFYVYLAGIASVSFRGIN